MGDIFASAKEMLDNISGKSVVMNMSVELAEYITKLYYALKAGEYRIYEKYCPCREQKHPRPDPDALLPMRAVFLF